MEDETLGPFWLGPNWSWKTERSAGGLRLFHAIREDGDGKKHVAYVRELPAKPNANTCFVAETLDGRRIAPERPTGPNHSLEDIMRYLGDR